MVPGIDIYEMPGRHGTDIAHSFCWAYGGKHLATRMLPAMEYQEDQMDKRRQSLRF
jgi:hypothetical protein